MPISFKCACGKGLSVRDEFAEKVLKCPSCGKPVRVPGAVSAGSSRPAQPKSPAASAALADLFDEEGFGREIAAACPACASEMSAQAILCTKCGFNKQTGQRMTGHRVAGVDIDMGTVALMNAQKALDHEVTVQKTMQARSGMPSWALALLLFIIASGTGIGVLTVNSMRREEQLEFKPLQTFVAMGGTAFALVAAGALLTMGVRIFKAQKGDRLRQSIRPALVAIFCGSIAGGFFYYASTL